MFNRESGVSRRITSTESDFGAADLFRGCGLVGLFIIGHVVLLDQGLGRTYAFPVKVSNIDLGVPNYRL